DLPPSGAWTSLTRPQANWVGAPRAMSESSYVSHNRRCLALFLACVTDRRLTIEFSGRHCTHSTRARQRPCDHNGSAARGRALYVSRPAATRSYATAQTQASRQFKHGASRGTLLLF